jgi:thiazole synthase
MPDPVGTLHAARQLIDEDFVVLPYISDDPVLARQLASAGCATVMPLASPIGSGRGIINFDRIRIIVAESRVPVVVDAGLGVPSDASMAMELGASACLVNTAIAQAQNPALMAEAFRLGMEAGRRAYHAGRIPKRDTAAASSPRDGVVR